MQARRVQARLNQINYKIQLIKTKCRRRLIDMAEIESIINNWELMSNRGAYQENDVAEPYGIEEAVEDVLGEY
jgi:hypothetical protein